MRYGNHRGRDRVEPIARTSNDVASTVLPMNTVGGALALGLLALRAIARRLFAESN